MLQEILKKVVEGKNLGFEEAKEAVIRLMSGEEPPEIISAFLVALRMKGETPEEIAGFAQGMREKAVRVDIGDIPAIDTCGTGGDGLNTFNASTCSAIVVSAIGVPVAKHGNKAVSSKTGSADILEKVGIPVNIPPEKAKDELVSKNFVFLFAPIYHPAMKEVAPIRRKLGIRTIFNVLGPLTNPAGVRRQIIGVFSPEYARKVAEAISTLGAEKVAVVCGKTEKGYIDEVSPCGKTLLIEVSKEGKITEGWITPEELGLKKRWTVDDIRQSENPEKDFQDVISGEGGDTKSPLIDFVSANAGIALWIAGKVSYPEKGVEKVKEELRSGRVKKHFEKLKTK